MIQRLPYLLLAALWLVPTAGAQLDDELEAKPKPTLTKVAVELPPYLTAGQTFDLKVVFRVPKGFHIYGPKETRWVPTAVRVSGTRSIRFGKPIYPKPVVKKIPHLGKAAMYEGTVTVRVPGKVIAEPKYVDRPQALRVKAAWGTCNDKVCKESLFIDRNPHELTAATRVLLTAPKISAPMRVAPGKPFAFYVAFDIPEEHHLTDARILPTPVPGITWSKPELPKAEHGKYHGLMLVKITGAVAADARLGPIAVGARLGWKTHDESGCHETVKELALALRIAVSNKPTEERVTNP